MSSPILLLLLIVAAVRLAHRRPAFASLFRWLPEPLWCYALPMLATALGWLPHQHPAYQRVIHSLLPFALALMLLGVDVPSLLRIGWRALAATALGNASIVLGAPLVAAALQSRLPADAWKGVGTLAATWTGGSMNLLAMKTILGTPDHIFTALIIVDALIAYSWMALLVGLSSVQRPMDRWLQARPLRLAAPPTISTEEAPGAIWEGLACALCAVLLAWGAQALAARLPTNVLVSSPSGWTVLLVTSAALAASFLRPIRRLSRPASSWGLPCLYLVLAAMGAQASLAAVRSAPVWVALGVGVAFIHGAVMLLGGRLLRLPLSLLATASQANLGGVASTPLVGAVYDLRLAPVGLLLAIGCNAVGTYWGLCAAFLAKLLLAGQ